MAKPKLLKEDISKLRQEGKSYKQICEILGCSKGTLSYHCGDNQKELTKNRTKKVYEKYPFYRKLDHFLRRIPNIVQSNSSIKFNKTLDSIIKKKLMSFERPSNKIKYKNMSELTITPEQILNKFGKDPKCYLTGKNIDWSKTSEYHFDHIIPISREGKNTIDNLGICIKSANMAKSDLLVDELIDLCKEILKHNGYNITKSE